MEPGAYGLDILDDILLRPAKNAVGMPGKFRPRAKLRAKNEKPIIQPPLADDCTKCVSSSFNLLHATEAKCLEKHSTTSAISFVSSSSIRSCSTAPAEASGELLMTQEPVNCTEATSIDDGDLQISLQKSRIEADMVSYSLKSLDNDLLKDSVATDSVHDKLDHLGQSLEVKWLEDGPKFPSFPSINSSIITKCSSAAVDPYSEPLSNQELIDPSEASHSESPVIDNYKNMKNAGTSRQEAAAVSSSESFDDILSEPTTTSGWAVGKLQPKPTVQWKNKRAISVSSMLPVAVDLVLPPDPQIPSQIWVSEDSLTSSAFPTSASVQCSTTAPCNSAFVEPCSPSFLAHGYLNQPDIAHSETDVYGANQDSCLNNRDLRKEETMDLSSLGTLDRIPFQSVTTVQGVGKFRPKPKEQTITVKPACSVIAPDAMEQDSFPVDAQSLPSETGQMELSPTHSTLADAFVDASTLHSHDFAPIGPGCDAGAPNLESEVSASQQDLQTVPRTSSRRSSKSRKRKPPTESEETRKDQSGSVEGTSPVVLNDIPVAVKCGENEAHKSSRQLRKRMDVQRPVHEIEDETSESSGDLEMDRDISYDDDYIGDDSTKHKRARRKPKRPASGNDKPVRRAKKPSEEPDPVTKKSPPKKFPHSTRRNKRQVSKMLLENPELETEPEKLMLKDLIILAEMKERKMKKEAAAQKKSFPNQSSDNSVPSDTPFDDDNPSASMQDLSSHDEEENHRDEHANHRVEQPKMLNYHTYMVRTHRERWSKSDTELFYKAIRQFGTDFAMIQQLFPGRTRHQVKLKYKAEERKHPLQLTDALTHRSKDHIHFELVIEKLQAEAEQNSNRDFESPQATADTEQNCNEDAELPHGNSENEEEVEKSEWKEEEASKDWEPERPHEDPYTYDWSHYESPGPSSTKDSDKGDYNV